MDLLLSLIFITFNILSSQALVSCKSGECVINCDTENCDIVICTNYASSCIINCLDNKCKDSQFYLAARNYNTVYCTGETACNEINIECGSPDQPPIGYSEYDFIGRYDSLLKCNFVSKPHSFIATNPTPKPTLPKLHKPLAGYPNTPAPTNSAHVPLSTEIQTDELKSISKSNSNSGSIVGTEILIVLSSVGLFCVIFTICFCICMSIDYHQKLTLLRKQHEQHIADDINSNNGNGIFDENIINNSIMTTMSNLTTNINNNCEQLQKSMSNCNISPNLGSNAESVATKLSTNCNNSNAASTKLSNISKHKASNSTTDIPSFSLSPIESQKSGYIITMPITENGNKSNQVQDSEIEIAQKNNVHNTQNESEPNLDTKLSMSITNPIIIGGLHNRDMISDTLDDLPIEDTDNDTCNNTVIRKDTNITNNISDITQSSNTLIEQSIPSVPSGDYNGDLDCCDDNNNNGNHNERLYDFSIILNENHTDDNHSVYHE